MDIQRLIAFVVFSFSALLLWDAWQKHSAPKVPTQQSQEAGKPASGTAPTPSVPLATPASPAVTPSVPGAPAAAPVEATGQPITVRTDLFEVELNTVGGDIRRVTLFKVFSALDHTKQLTLLAPQPGVALAAGTLKFVGRIVQKNLTPAQTNNPTRI